MRQSLPALRPFALALLISTPLWCQAQEETASTALPEALQPSAEHPLDLDRYMGQWYVIGRIANPVERGHVASRHDYSLDEDGKVRITYHFRESFEAPPQALNLRASVDDESGNRRWRTWFYKVVPTRTEVLEVAPDYSWALIGYPGRDMAWILAREPEMSQVRYFQLSSRLAEHGVNTDRMRRVLQEPEQRGRLGFEAAGRR
nr:lipocalin family protein [Stenotrophomonas ginsengisoli]